MSRPVASAEAKDLVVFGNLVLDDVVHADGSTRMNAAGGAVLYLPLAASLWGLSVGIVSPLGEDYPERPLDELARRGVDLAGLVPTGRPGLHTWLLYEGAIRRVVHRLDSAGHEEASPTIADLPAAWSARWYHLAPIPLPMQEDLVTGLARRGPARISLDPYELIRTADIERWHNVLGTIDLLLFSEDELDDDTVRRRPEPFLRQLAQPIAGDGDARCSVAFKRGARGGLLYNTREDRFVAWPGRATAVVDPTGAGDAFAAGLVSGLLRDEPLGRALCMGMVSAAFAIEGHGPAGLLAATPQRAETRFDECWLEWRSTFERSFA